MISRIVLIIKYNGRNKEDNFSTIYHSNLDAGLFKHFWKGGIQSKASPIPLLSLIKLFVNEIKDIMVYIYLNKNLI